MNKKFILFLSLILIVTFYSLHLDKVLKKRLIRIQTSLSTFYVSTLNSAISSTNLYFNQLNTIKQLQKENQTLLHYKELYDIAQNNLVDINNSFSKTISKNLKTLIFENINVVKYYKFNENSKVILDKYADNNASIEALITLNGYSAGIVFNKEVKKVAYLNNNTKCNYAVIIGKNKASAITSGMTSSGYIILKYIPLWKQIYIDDKVITSGMDGIFPYGINVGIITKITKDDTTQTAYLKPFAKVFGVRNFLIYKKNKN